MKDAEFDRAMRQLATEWARAWDDVARAMEDAQRTMDEFAALLCWQRFDTLYGPIIGGVVIIGTLIISGLSAYWSTL